jgi:hypothetical protein
MRLLLPKFDLIFLNNFEKTKKIVENNKTPKNIKHKKI